MVWALCETKWIAAPICKIISNEHGSIGFFRTNVCLFNMRKIDTNQL